MEMNETELLRIQSEARADEAAENQTQEGAEPVSEGEYIPADLSQEFAEFLDLMAKVAGHGLALPAIPARFSHQANVDIASAAIKLCQKYGIDARAVLIGEDSTIGAWLGLGVALGLPSYQCWADWKAKKAAEVKKGAESGEGDNKRADE